ncbi:hypothetical protein T01_14486 [Trichinella spiralis]|uniref:Uncharacterized protein n=1 Tax=Trichinella spiralis TaxID=6334 RepID=A0A0V1AP41_TRISP|nr:hypothetical protein T01_14486 [Trichinella spiralis]
MKVKRFSEIKVMHHINVGITGTIRRNLQRTTISYKHIQLHMEKKQVVTICFFYNNNKDETININSE